MQVVTDAEKEFDEALDKILKQFREDMAKARQERWEKESLEEYERNARQ